MLHARYFVVGSWDGCLPRGDRSEKINVVTFVLLSSHQLADPGGTDLLVDCGSPPSPTVAVGPKG